MKKLVVLLFICVCVFGCNDMQKPIMDVIGDDVKPTVEVEIPEETDAHMTADVIPLEEPPVDSVAPELEPPIVAPEFPFRPINVYVDPAPHLNRDINHVLDHYYDLYKNQVIDPSYGIVEGVMGWISRDLYGVPYTPAILQKIDEIYREILEIPGVPTEYFKLGMLNPDASVDELLDMLRESLLHSVDWDMTYRHLRRHYYLDQIQKYNGDVRVVIERATRIFELEFSELYNGDDLDEVRQERRIKVGFRSRSLGAYVRLKLEHPYWGWDEIWHMIDPDGLDLSQSIVPSILEIPLRNFSLK